ncbi:hypothetical protein E2C01_068788 [Portunus trituberculatus]|uniref:Uncharacterized protein n=1 Tax=Portunus trituberculatus TaxID=210409 RepID=A0A5B7HPR2_PORTR|nr:hypothetical protein [Portunus trituberculatus]
MLVNKAQLVKDMRLPHLLGKGKSGCRTWPGRGDVRPLGHRRSLHHFALISSVGAVLPQRVQPEPLQ